MGGDLGRVRAIADYQFGRGAGAALFPDGSSITLSKNTGRIRHVYLGDALLASFRPTDGLLTLTMAGAERLVSGLESLGYKVTAEDEVAEFISQGRNVFAKHVLDAGEKVRPGDEVVVVDSGGRVLAVGRALLNREEMLAFSVGVAVKVRRGRDRHR